MYSGSIWPKACRTSKDTLLNVATDENIHHDSWLGNDKKTSNNGILRVLIFGGLGLLRRALGNKLNDYIALCWGRKVVLWKGRDFSTHDYILYV